MILLSTSYRIIFETYNLSNEDSTLSRSEIMRDTISKPTNCLDFSLDHENQIQLIQSTIDHIIAEKIKLLNDSHKDCVKCSERLVKSGNHVSTFHDVFTDHSVTIQRFKCLDCNEETSSTVRTLLNGTLSGALAKIQSELGSTYTYRESESILETFSTQKRKINNRNRIKKILNSVGETISKVDSQEQELLSYVEAKELIVNVDGGHVKTTEDQRSIEALTSVVYRPESLISNDSGTRN